MVTCFMCGAKFKPRPDKLKEWVESGRDFEPTDWECKTCYNLTPLALDEGDSSAPEGDTSPEVLSAGQAGSTPALRQ